MTRSPTWPAQPPADLDVVDYIAQTRDSYAQLGYEPYRWAEEPHPASLTSPVKALADSKVALVGSAGIYKFGQQAFHHRDDTSHRLIPIDTPNSDLRTSHFAYDLTSARQDPNAVFPLEPLRQMVAAGQIGSLADNALAFMGGIYSQRRLAQELIPVLADELAAMNPDVVVLVPV